MDRRIAIRDAAGNVIAKPCSKCGIAKDASAFGTSLQRGKRVLRSRCRKCQAEYDHTRQVEGGEDRRRKTRERVSAHRKTPAGKALQLRANRNWRARNREKARAHWTLERAIARGDVTVTGICVICQKGGAGDRHHDDYSTPLEFREMHKECHMKYHNPVSPDQYSACTKDDGE